jgi:hypothetical protein
MLTPSQEELPTLLTIHERRGHFDEVLSLLEAGLSLERAHVCANFQAFSCHSHLSARWASSSSWEFRIANTDPEHVSCHSCHFLIFEDFILYFSDISNKECFAALLFICCDLPRSDVVEELS